VSNPAGSALSSVATLTVGAVPVITQQPQSLAATPGATVLFSVVATGGGLTYQWRFNSNSLPGQTSATLTLNNVQLGNVGAYSVVISNQYGVTTSANGYLAMTGPSITLQPQSQTNYAGTTAMFSVTAGGDAPLSYQWRKSGVNLSSATNSILALPNAQPADNDNYNVVVGNPVGSVTSLVATLTVIVPVQISRQPISQTSGPGSNVTFAVVATGTGTLHYQWRFNGTNLLSNPTATSSNLMLTNVQLTDNGTYSVVVSDDISSITSSNATLTVLVKPVITVQPTNVAVFPGGNATFFIEASGTTPISFRWRRGGLTFTNGIIISTPTNSTLTVTNVQLTNDGNVFNVALTNIAGSAAALSSNAVLTVLMPPVLSDPQVLPDGAFRMFLQGNANRSYGIEISSNLANWSTLTTLNYTNGRMPVLDATATNAPQRFYRARLVP
jgi:hypothetical protein